MWCPWWGAQVIAGGWERQVFLWQESQSAALTEEDSHHRTLQGHECAAGHCTRLPCTL